MHEREPLLLVSKLRVPPWRPHWLPRPRLLHCVAQETETRLLLCSAPAGFGKTTALIAWVKQQRARAALAAWYTLDAADNDLTRFAAYLVGAFAQADEQLPLAELRSSAGADIECLLVGLLNLLGAAGRPYVLVLDDYHLIQSPAVHQVLAMLLDHLPANVQIALGTRADPPLPLARLRARGLLTELRAADLQFDKDEIAAFFQRQGRAGCSADTLALLGTWTEGWVAGMQLAALALPQATEEEVALETIHALIAGSQRHIFTFLADEVFAQQSPEVQEFLLATSVVDHLTPGLCDALLGDRRRTIDNAAMAVIRRPSSVILAELEQAHLFLIRLDSTRPWYRYHHLFSDFLRHRLDCEQPERRTALHRRAARWYAEAGEITQAVNYALASGDMDGAAELIVHSAWAKLSARGEVETILDWAGRFPREHLADKPLLCLYFGRAAFLSEQLNLAEQFFALAEQGFASAPSDDAALIGARAKLLTYRAATASMAGEVTRAFAQLAAAEPILSPHDPLTRAAHILTVGIGHYLRGELDAASAAFERLAGIARQASHDYLAAAAVQLLALLDLVAGRLEPAEQRCTALLTRFTGELPAIPDLGLALVRLGAVAYHRGHLEQAAQLLRKGAQLRRRSIGHTDRQIWPWLLRVAVARGEQAELCDLLAEPEGQREADGDVVLSGLRMAARAEALLALGAVDEAWRWAQRGLHLPGEHLREAESVTVARVLLARRQPAEALARLDRLVVAAESGGRNGPALEGLLVQAHALSDMGCTSEALGALRRALALAEPAGYVQVFRDEGPSIAALLGRIQQEGGSAKAYITQLLAGVPAQKTPLPISDPHPDPGLLPPLIEALTEREQEVLHLLADGATNQDIADTLVVKVGTIKTHLSHILGKLGARNRTEAVARARALGLL